MSMLYIYIYIYTKLSSSIKIIAIDIISFFCYPVSRGVKVEIG